MKIIYNLCRWIITQIERRGLIDVEIKSIVSHRITEKSYGKSKPEMRQIIFDELCGLK